MTDPASQRRNPDGGTRRAAGRPLRPTLLTTLVSAIVFAASMYAVIRTELSTTEAELAAAAALLTFGVMIYGLLGTLLALVESATERRRQAREATERRHGERKKTPD